MKLSFRKTGVGILVACALWSCKKDDLPADELPLPHDMTGEIVWSKNFGGSNEDEAVSIIQTPDGGYAVAGFTLSTDGDILDKNTNDSDIWVFKLNAEGELLWSKTYGGSGDDKATKIINTIDGGLAVIGFTRSEDGDISQNNGFYDYWLLKLSSSGNLLWEKTYGYSGNDQGQSVIQTGDGGFFLSGFLDFDGKMISTSEEKNSRNLRHGVGEFWGIKTDASGQIEWEEYFGGTNNDRAYDAIETEDGGFLMVGSTESDDFDITDPKGSYDFWAVRINQTGEKIWQKNYGGSQIDIAYSVTKTQTGNFLILGDTRSNDQDVTNHKGNADAWLIQIDDNGTLNWQLTYGGTQFDTGRYVEEFQDNKLLVFGTSRSLDGDVASNYGESDLWMAVINPNGSILFEKNYGGSNREFGNSACITNDNKVVLAGSSESNDFDVPENKGGKDALILKLK